MEIDSLLKPYQRFGVHLGLDRIYNLLQNLGNPHHQVPVIHVAGTNGKGSVCAYLSAVFAEAGYRTGRYTSPHLVHWNERICLNEQPISTPKFCQLLQQVEAAINPEDESPTQFEVITATAILYFAQQQVDVAVVEVGLGGRLDATNVWEKPLVTIVTSISREHWQQLGSTVAEIAGEKAGILKPGCPVVIGSLPPSAQKVIGDRALQLHCPVFIPNAARELAQGWAEYGEEEATHTLKYPLCLNGQIQLTNSALAIATLEILQNRGWQISPEDIVQGLAKTKWLGRMQWTTWKNQKLLLDGAHNPAAAKVLRHYVDNQQVLHNTQSTIGTTWIMGMLTTKDHTEIFKALLQPNDKLHLVPVPDHSSANIEDLQALAKSICPRLNFCHTYADLTSGLEAAFNNINNLVVLCGSLYLVGHFLHKFD